MKNLKFLFLLPLVAIDAQALEPKYEFQPKATEKTGFTT